jgi:hypothetical protein
VYRVKDPQKSDADPQPWETGYGCSVCCRRRLYFLHTFSWLCNCFGIFFILAAHEHYSIGKEDHLYFQLSLTVKIVKSRDFADYFLHIKMQNSVFNAL